MTAPFATTNAAKAFHPDVVALAPQDVIPEALIIQIEFPNAGPGADRERLRRDAHAGLFRAVVVGDVHAAWTFGETGRIVSPHGRDKQLVSVDGIGPSRLWSAESPVTAAS